MLGSSLCTAGEPLVCSSGEQLPFAAAVETGTWDSSVVSKAWVKKKKACRMQMNKEIFLFAKLLQKMQLLSFAVIKNEVPLHQQ